MSETNDLPEVVATPTHDDFCCYLPWACLQFGVPAVVSINKIFEGGLDSNKLNPEVSKPVKDPKTNSVFHLPSTEDKESASNNKNPKIYITAIYNSASKLVRIAFEDMNCVIPREVMKVIKLIIHTQVDLKRLEIKSGVDKFIVHEISEIIKVSHLTEVCLDRAFVREGNYAALLKTASLRYLSLSKCKINDTIIKEICKNLEHPKPASKSLIALILSTNMITDDGAKFLGETLRSNRKLAYINLADNGITDEGAGCIFDTLVEFSVRPEELVAARGRRFAYLKERNSATIEKAGNVKSDRKSTRRKSRSPPSSRKGKKHTLKSRDSSKTNVTSTSPDRDRTARRIENVSEDFNDPFHFPNIYTKEGTLYSKGNFALLYLNVAYNNLTYLSLKKILEVVRSQKISDTRKGLLDVNINGNHLPVDCEEVEELDELLNQKRSLSELSIIRSPNRRRRSKNTKQRKGTE